LCFFAKLTMPNCIYKKLFSHRSFFAFWVLCFLPGFLSAQEQIEILHADLFGYEKGGEKFQQLTNNVMVKQDNLILYCDSALKNDTRNVMDAYGHVRLVQGDSLTITGEFLHYDGTTRVANIQNNVILTQPDFTLTTQELVYDTKAKIGYYPVYGKLVNKDNTLTRNTGYYYAKEKYSYFKRTVDLKNKDYHITCDTLKYDNNTSVAYFLGFTTIVKLADSTIITCNNGWYDKVKGNSQFSKKVKVTQPEQILYCDSMIWNNEKENGKAYRDILLLDTVNRLQVSGNYGDYDRKHQTTKISDKAIATQLMDNDSMHLHGDTLYFYNDSIEGKRIFAYKKVKIYKSNMQAVADSMRYSFKDSIMVFYTHPILWVDSTQLTADTISIKFKNQKADRLFMRRNSFIASLDDSVRFNQIKGKDIDGFFTNNNLHLVKVYHEGECIYYIKDDAKAYLGVNKIKSEGMDIYLDSSKVQAVNYRGKPDGIMYPIMELKPKELQLKNFFWHNAVRPKSKKDLLK
jgi:lipopolysaccharide export system protein LptA